MLCWSYDKMGDEWADLITQTTALGSQKEGTTLLLADIFATCFGWDTIKHIKEPVLLPCNGSRIDPKFVNNPELSDVTFR